MNTSRHSRAAQCRRPHRPVRDRLRNRCWRHGRGLSRARHPAEPRRRHQGPADIFASNAERLARFTREGQTIASVNHPDIAVIHGLEQAGDLRALVMELVPGHDLSQRISRGEIPLADALSIARQIEALDAAHEQSIHRDLKPVNTKVRPDGTVKVLE